MNKSIAIIAGEPNSISSEIIFKSWKLRRKHSFKPLFVIGNIKLLNLQKKKLKYQIKNKKINNNFKVNDLKLQSRLGNFRNCHADLHLHELNLMIHSAPSPVHHKCPQFHQQPPILQSILHTSQNHR